jgi:hypothetical protein
MEPVSTETWLQSTFANKEWFDSVGRDQYGRLTVYVRFMNMETMTGIPSQMNGEQIMVHFAANKAAKSENFTLSGSSKPVTLTPVAEEELDNEGELPSYLLESDVGDLIQELERLEKICGTNILQDIFYEIHDGDNAVTSLSIRYPDVKVSLQKLYDEYGFDVIYEEMDG